MKIDNSIKDFFDFLHKRKKQIHNCKVREQELWEFTCFCCSVFMHYNSTQTFLVMTNSEYNKLKNHLESKLKFYQNSLANSERKTNFHGKKFYRVNSFEAAIRIEEINFLLSYLETEMKPESIFKKMKDFFILKFKLFKIKIGFKNELDKIKI